MAKERYQFNSTRVSEAWYDADHRRIRVRFPDGVYWRYDNVSRGVWMDFISASSAGHFLNEVLTKKHPNKQD